MRDKDPPGRVVYMVLPYAGLAPKQLGSVLPSFSLGNYDIWIDTADHWERYLSIPRPATHLKMYLDFDGSLLSKMWIATPRCHPDGIGPDDWKNLVAALFHLAFASSDPGGSSFRIAMSGSTRRNRFRGTLTRIG